MISVGGLSAFGVVHKGLPSSLKSTPLSNLKPLSVGAAKKQAHLTGKQAARATAMTKDRRLAPFNQGHTTLRYIAGETRNAGRQAGQLAQTRIQGRQVPPKNRKRVLP